MLTHIKRDLSGAVTLVESIPLPPKRRGGKRRSQETATTYKDWSEVPDGSELQTYVTCDCCGAIEMDSSVPLTDPKLSKYAKKLGGHRWCGKCQSERRSTKLSHPFSNRQPNSRYCKDMRVSARFEYSPVALERKEKLVELVDRIRPASVRIE